MRNHARDLVEGDVAPLLVHAEPGSTVDPVSADRAEDA